MQPATTHKKKYTIEDYISPNRANPMIRNFSNKDKVICCVCEPKDQVGLVCFKCKSFVHACLASSNNRGEQYECLPCLNRALDPQVQVRKVLVENYFKTFYIFDYVNIINFEFYLGQEDLGHQVEIRGLVPDSTSLTWPMQGAFYLNEDKNSFHDLKPLLANSNRKHRREEYFNIPVTGLKAGKNILTFKIPCLDRNKFTAKFQFQDRKVYFMAVNSVERLTPADLETQTFRERRIEQADSIKLLKSNNAEIEVLSNKVCLVCPYTRERIKVPVRGRYCKHFSCICLQTLIASHSASRYWGCPICELKINEPYVDVWIYNMLKDNQQGSEVRVNDNGTYEWVKQSKEAVMSLDSEDQSPPMKMPVPPPKAKSTQVKVESIANEAKKILKEALEQKKEIPQQANIISLDDEDEERSVSQRKETSSKKTALKKVKEKLKEAKNTKQQPQKSEKPEKPEKPDKPEKPEKSNDIENKRKEASSLEKPRQQITDIKLLQPKQLKADQFKRLYLNSKARANPFRKYIQTQQLKRLFKEIL